MIPPGTRIAFSGGTECQDTARIWAVLDKALTRYPDMVLMHGNAKGADTIASLWASNRKVTQIPFEPDWKKDGKACVFKRNDRMLEAQPAHLIAFDGTSITANIVDKAKKLHIPLQTFARKRPLRNRQLPPITAVYRSGAAVMIPQPASTIFLSSAPASTIAGT